MSKTRERKGIGMSEGIYIKVKALEKQVKELTDKHDKVVDVLRLMWEIKDSDITNLKQVSKWLFVSHEKTKLEIETVLGT